MRTRVAALLIALIAPCSALAGDPSSASYSVLTPTLAPGGYATSSSFSLIGILSPFIGHGRQSSASFSALSGFPAFPYISTPVVSATAGNASVALTWSSALGALGWTPSSYAVGQATASGGPYTYTNVGNVLSSTPSSLTAGTPYYFIIRVLDAFSATIATSTEVSATPTAPAPPPSGGGGGGGGGGIITTTVTNGGTVNFSGRAYPASTITLLKDAQVVASNFADSNADFSITLAGITPGNYIFSVYSEDNAGNRSSLLSFPVSVTAGLTTNIGGIFITPTIDTDKSQVKKGDNIAIFGQSVPKGSVTITVNSDTELFLQTRADAIGAYLYNLDTAPLELGSHIAKSKAATSTEISSFGAAIGFMVGAQNVKRASNQKQATCIPADLNCDGSVNLVDFSMMAYWYKRPLVGNGLKADLNHDNKVDLVDFSIMMSHWTG